jgi:hypothetical protein
MDDQGVWATLVESIGTSLWIAGIVVSYYGAQVDGRNRLVWTVLAVVVPVIPALILGALLWARPHIPTDDAETGYHPAHKRNDPPPT